MRKLFRSCVGTAAMILGFSPDSAVAITFDWEIFGTSTNSVPIYQMVGGLTATVTGVGGNGKVVVHRAPTSFTGFGLDSLSVGGNSEFLRVDFSYPVVSVSLQFGDSNADDDGTVTARAYDASNVLVDVESLLYGTILGVRSLTLDAPDIAYVVTGTTGSVQFPNSIVYDNYVVTPAPGFIPVPEPSTLGLLGLSLAALVIRARRVG